MKACFHPLTQAQLTAITATPTAYLFVGPNGSGRTLAVTQLACRLNCPSGGDDDCSTCRAIASGSFADFITISSDVKSIAIDQVKDLQSQLANRPLNTNKVRVALIAADNGITDTAQNRLLKTLEEPPLRTIIIITTITTGALLTTLLSRCHKLQFLPLPPAELAGYLHARVDSDVANQVLALAPTTIGSALTLAHNQTLRNQELAISKTSARFMLAPVFERLTTIASDGIVDQARTLINHLAAQAMADVQLFDRLPAIDRALKRLSANLGARTVLEALALEL